MLLILSVALAILPSSNTPIIEEVAATTSACADNANEVRAQLEQQTRNSNPERVAALQAEYAGTVACLFREMGRLLPAQPQVDDDTSSPTTTSTADEDVFVGDETAIHPRHVRCTEDGKEITAPVEVEVALQVAAERFGAASQFADLAPAMVDDRMLGISRITYPVFSTDHHDAWLHFDPSSSSFAVSLPTADEWWEWCGTFPRPDEVSDEEADDV